MKIYYMVINMNNNNNNKTYTSIRLEAISPWKTPLPH